MLLLQAYRSRNFLSQRKDERDHVFGNHRPMHFTCVCENNLAVDEFRKHELMNRRRRRVNPAQLLRRRDLLGTNRPGDNDLSVGDFVINAPVVGKVDNVELRKFLLQPLWKPSRRVPLIKWMMDEHEQFANWAIG